MNQVDAAWYIELFEHLPVACVITNAAGVIEAGNAAAVALLRTKRELMIGMPLPLLLQDNDRRELRRHVNELALGNATQASISGTVRYRDDTVQDIVAEASVFAFDGKHQIAWVIQSASHGSGKSTDTRRFQDEHAGRMAAELASRRFRLLAEVGRLLTAERDIPQMCDAVARAVVKYAADYCAVYLIEGSTLCKTGSAAQDAHKGALADAILRRYEITIDDIDGLLWRSILTGDPHTVPPLAYADTGERGLREFFGLLREHGPRNAIVFPLRRGGHSFGAIVILTTWPAPVFTAEDAGVLLEVTTRTALAIDNAVLVQKLERANTEKSEFLAVISHELRTPLTAVIGYAELLLAGIPEELTPITKLHVERIRTSAMHQLTIVEQLLDHTRPLPGGGTLARSPIDLRLLVSEVVTLIQSSASEKGLVLTVDVPEAITLKSDVGRVRQILLNLAMNAVKYSDSGTVEISVRGSDDEVSFAVSDNGVGIAEDQIGRVFDPYWRATTTGTGVGLGLSVSRKLARLLGGDINVESKIGVGSTFTLKLPTE